MPILVLACRMCPKNIEGTLYSFIISTWNIGSNISYLLASFVLDRFRVTESNFDNLTYLVLLNNSL